MDDQIISAAPQNDVVFRSTITLFIVQPAHLGEMAETSLYFMFSLNIAFPRGQDANDTPSKHVPTGVDILNVCQRWRQIIYGALNRGQYSR